MIQSFWCSETSGEKHSLILFIRIGMAKKIVSPNNLRDASRCWSTFETLVPHLSRIKSFIIFCAHWICNYLHSKRCQISRISPESRKQSDFHTLKMVHWYVHILPLFISSFKVSRFADSMVLLFRRRKRKWKVLYLVKWSGINSIYIHLSLCLFDRISCWNTFSNICKKLCEKKSRFCATLNCVDIFVFQMQHISMRENPALDDLLVQVLSGLSSGRHVKLTMHEIFSAKLRWHA